MEKTAPPSRPLNNLEMKVRNENGGRTHIDPRTRRRSVPFELLILGMPRTGTLCAFRRHPGVYLRDPFLANPQDAQQCARPWSSSATPPTT